MIPHPIGITIRLVHRCKLVKVTSLLTANIIWKGPMSSFLASSVTALCYRALKAVHNVCFVPSRVCQGVSQTGGTVAAEA